MKRRHLRHLVLVGLAVGLVLLIRTHVLGGYRIPSSSMAPTFLGNPDSGDRVLVDKTRFIRRAPERWMLAVFRRPGDRRTYVKRLVGLPGDLLLIRDGDVYNHGALLIKPDAVLDEVLVPVYDETAHRPRFDAFWCVTSGEADPSSEGILLLPGPDGPAAIQTRDEITDGHLDREGRFRPGRNVVPDLEVRIRFTPGAGARSLEVELDRDRDRIRVRVGIGAAGRIELPGGATRPLPGLKATPGREHQLTVSNVDSRLRVRWDGVVVCDQSGTPPDRGQPLPPRRTRVEVTGSGGPLRISGLRIRRDLHFTRDGEHATATPTRVDSDHYFLLGDNSGESVDSRQWGPVPGAGLIGEPVLIFWPLRRFRLF